MVQKAFLFWLVSSIMSLPKCTLVTNERFAISMEKVISISELLISFTIYFYRAYFSVTSPQLWGGERILDLG